MNQMSGVVDASAVMAKKKLAAKFLKKGIIIALFSGFAYGLYSAFLTLGMSRGFGRIGTGPTRPVCLLSLLYICWVPLAVL